MAGHKQRNCSCDTTVLCLLISCDSTGCQLCRFCLEVADKSTVMVARLQTGTQLTLADLTGTASCVLSWHTPDIGTFLKAAIGTGSEQSSYVTLVHSSSADCGVVHWQDPDGLPDYEQPSNINF